MKERPILFNAEAGVDNAGVTQLRNYAQWERDHGGDKLHILDWAACEIERLHNRVAELEAGSKAVAGVILIFDKTDKTFVRDTDELMKLAGLNPGMGYEAVGMQDDGTSVVFDRCGNFGYLDERYSPVITTPQPVKVPDAMRYGDSPFEQRIADGYFCRGWNDCREAMLAAQELTK